MRWPLALACCLAMLAAACAAPGGGEMTVYAAASLTNVTDPIAAAWATDHAQESLTFSTGSSAALRAQIEQGAPADVFLSADAANPQALVSDGLADRPVSEFATNALAVIVPAGNPAAIATPADLARPGVCVIAAGPEVPITVYAEKVVARLAALPGYGSDFVERYEANVCSREDNVAAVVGKIGLGEGDAGIVYATDAAAASGVELIPIPSEANVVAIYGAVVISRSPNSAAGRAFLSWLAGAQAQAVLARAGFRPPQ